MGVVPPEPGFLEGLRALTGDNSILLIFDEVMTGFRVHPSGAQGLYGIHPDLTTLGKVIGGGLPVGAYGGRAEIMQWVAPAGPMCQAGTLSGNPLTMAAGIATLGELRMPGVWTGMDRKAGALAAGISAAAEDAGIPLKFQRVGTMFTAFFSDRPVKNWGDAKLANTVRYAEYFRGMLEEGIYTAPSQFEAGFLSTAHEDEQIDMTVASARRVLHELSGAH